MPPLNAISEVQRARFVEVYAETLDETKARQRAQITIGELDRLRREDPIFEARLAEVRDRILADDLAVVERRLMDVAKQGDVGAAKFILAKRKPEVYGDKPGVVINISPDELKGKSLEELRETRERILKGRTG